LDVDLDLLPGVLHQRLEIVDDLADQVAEIDVRALHGVRRLFHAREVQEVEDMSAAIVRHL